MGDSHRLLITHYCNIVIQKATHQRAQLSGMPPQIYSRARVIYDIWGEEMRRRMLLLGALTSCLHVPFIIFLVNQIRLANTRHSVKFVAAVFLFMQAAVGLSRAISYTAFLA